MQWLGSDYALEGSVLVIKPGQRVELFVHRPQDYWHAPGAIATHLEPHMDIQIHSSADGLLTAVQQRLGERKVGVIGPQSSPSNQTLGEPNPPQLIAHLAFSRATKTDYEIEQIRAASRMAARGHIAARKGFYAGFSEFQIHLAYLEASQQNEHETPYPNIIAQNSHASVLHYQHQDRNVPNPLNSLLIDAGGRIGGYASDVTRTYVAQDDSSPFAALLDAMQTHQHALLDSVRPGINYLDLHIQMHQQLAGILTEHAILSCSAAQAYDEHWTEAFCPHGLGHLLGLQVHDVGGYQTTVAGALSPPPDNYSTLRLTKDLQANQVFTIEPGLYFISSLLEGLQQHNAPLNWPLIDRLQPYGGIRLEDNVRVMETGCENLTREAFAAIGTD